ncbi:MAG TPA: carbon-nitrogen hydrolase family protein [Actinomycetota bacterium]|nr:carbon-nitrogen hydrolase family protein [Actinomycetota bacterium]
MVHVSRLLTVLAAQVRPVAFDPEGTFARFEEHVRTAVRAFPDVDLLVFPELYLTGEDPFTGGPTDFQQRVAVEVPGSFTERVGKVAARAERWVVAGSVFERADGHVYNTALAFSPAGDLVATYRKLFPWRPFETTEPDDRPPTVFEIPGRARVGLMICYDGWFPEVARGLAFGGAELIVHPTLTTTPDREQELVLARANAIANQLYVVNVNSATTVGGGRSIAVDPEGRPLFELGQGEELAIETLDLDRVDVVRRGGTRGVTRAFQHVQQAPRPAFEAYRRFLADPR